MAGRNRASFFFRSSRGGLSLIIAWSFWSTNDICYVRCQTKNQAFFSYHNYKGLFSAGDALTHNAYVKITLNILTISCKSFPILIRIIILRNIKSSTIDNLNKLGQNAIVPSQAKGEAHLNDVRFNSNWVFFTNNDCLKVDIQFQKFLKSPNFGLTEGVIFNSENCKLSLLLKWQYRHNWPLSINSY